MLKNTIHHYGLITILLHWLIALACIGLFWLGWWMVELDYYDPWYTRGPHIHKSLGLLLLAVLLLRWLWRLSNPRVAPAGQPSQLAQRLARLAHFSLNGLVLLIIVSGYLISTADGRPIEVYDWFALPATLTTLPEQESLAGDIHRYLAYALAGLVIMHALAALKHHFIDRDNTLLRMLGSKQ